MSLACKCEDEPGRDDGEYQAKEFRPVAEIVPVADLFLAEFGGGQVLVLSSQMMVLIVCHSALPVHSSIDGSHNAISGKKSTRNKPIACKPMNGSTARKISCNSIPLGATDLRKKQAGPKGGDR